VTILLADDDGDGCSLLQASGRGPSVTVVAAAPDAMLAEVVAVLAPKVALVDVGRSDSHALDRRRQLSASRSHPRGSVLRCGATRCSG
jgi:hypothetical protein